MSNTRPEGFTPQAKAWSFEDAQAFRDFLARCPNFFPALAAAAPKIETKGTELAALTGAKHAGFEELFDALFSMQSDRPQDNKSPYLGAD